MQEKLVLTLKIDRGTPPYILQSKFSTEKKILFLLSASMLTAQSQVSEPPMLFLAIYSDPSQPSSPGLIN